MQDHVTGDERKASLHPLEKFKRWHHLDSSASSKVPVNTEAAGLGRCQQSLSA